MIDLDQWDYHLPDDRIARHPPPERDGSRLLVARRDGSAFQDRSFREFPELLDPGDLVVANDTRVMAGRLFARRRYTGGEVELLLLSAGPGPVEALLRPARRIREGEVLVLDEGVEIIVRERRGERFLVELSSSPEAVMAKIGAVPLPPYLHRDAIPEDRDRYQTTFAGPLGACAAPTAGLHFTADTIAALASRGIGFVTATLHVGIGTFRPPRAEDLAAGRLHEEPYAIPEETVARIESTRAAGGRIVAIGTTTTRALESAAANGGLRAGPGTTDLLLAPGSQLHIVDALLTNFHLPRSSLLLLVGALLGRDRVLASYAHAIASGYRFYSYGDAMLVL